MTAVLPGCPGWGRERAVSSNRLGKHQLEENHKIQMQEVSRLWGFSETQATLPMLAVTLQERKTGGSDSSQSPSWVGMWEFEVKSMKTA